MLGSSTVRSLLFWKACHFFLISVLCACFCLTGLKSARAEGASLLVPQVSCESLRAPGRLRCTLEARTGQGSLIEWIDVQLISAPDFVLPLRGRFAASEADVREPQLYRWTMAVAAKALGQGDLVFRFRAVVCPIAQKGPCIPTTIEQKGSIRVGN